MVETAIASDQAVDDLREICKLLEGAFGCRKLVYQALIIFELHTECLTSRGARSSGRGDKIKGAIAKPKLLRQLGSASIRLGLSGLRLSSHTVGTLVASCAPTRSFCQ